MRLVKPLRLGLVKRSLLWGGRTLLSFGLITAFPLASPRRIMKEGEMWEAIAPALGDQVLDSGEPKRRAEVVVFGHYFAPGNKPVLQHGVRVALGPIDKSIRVTGHREWATDAQGRVVPTSPEPFTSLPIDWKYAFGGPGFPANPGGRGYWPEDTRSADARYPLPLLEYPADVLTSPDDMIAPAGLGPRDIMLPARQQYAGTYDRYWADNHAPGLAQDATLDLFQVAATDQQFQGFIGGREPFTVENMHPEQPVQSGQLPGVRARAFVRRTEAPEKLEELPLATDSAILFPGIGLGLLIHRGSLWVSAFDHPEIDLFMAGFEWQEHAPRPQSYYEADLVRRLDPVEGLPLGLDYLSLSPEGWVEPPSEKATWFKVMQPRSFVVPPSLQAKIDEGRAMLAKMIPPDKVEAFAKAHVPKDDGPTLAALRAELAAFDASKQAGLKNPLLVKPQMDRIKALTRQVVDERVGATEDRIRTVMARKGMDYDALKAAAAAKPVMTPQQVMAQSDAALDRAAAGAPPAAREKILAAKVGQHAGLVTQAMSDLAALTARGKAAIGHAMPAPPPVAPAEAARRGAAAQALLDQGGDAIRGEFAGLDLSGFNFTGRDLTEADFAASILVGADFSGADLTRANFAGADLTDARMTGAKLQETNLGKTRLDRTDFGNAGIFKATFSEAEGSDTVFAGAGIEGVTAIKPRLLRPSFMGAKLKEVNFLDAELDEANFDQANLEKLVLLNSRADRASFRGALLVRPTMVKSTLQGADFSRASIERLSTAGGVDLRDSRFDHARMPAASLIGVVLTGTSWTATNAAGALFNNADLRMANFHCALLRGALLMRANLVEARFDGSDCADASFIRADMRWASLRQTSLYGADLTDARLDDAVIDGGMIDNTLLAGRNFPS